MAFMTIRMHSLEEISELIRDNRKIAGLSQQRLAKMCGLSQSTIARIETDAAGMNPSYQTIMQIVGALNEIKTSPGEQLLSKKAQEIMHRRIIHLKPSDTVAEAIRIFKDYDFPQLPVFDQNKHVLGTVYQKDVLNVATQTPDLVGRKPVGSMMKGSLPQIDRSTEITRLKPILENVGAAIVTENGKAIGIITIYDVIKNV